MPQFLRALAAATLLVVASLSSASAQGMMQHQQGSSGGARHQSPPPPRAAPQQHRSAPMPQPRPEAHRPRPPQRPHVDVRPRPEHRPHRPHVVIPYFPPPVIYREPVTTYVEVDEDDIDWDDCPALKRRALRTDSKYWWRKYRDCRDREDE